jgi:hypothetical protein
MRRAEQPRDESRPAPVGSRPATEWTAVISILVEGRRRQDPGQPSRHHRLAAARRPDHQEIVIAGASDLERTPRQRLAANIGQVRDKPAAAPQALPRDGRSSRSPVDRTHRPASDATGMTRSPR